MNSCITRCGFQTNNNTTLKTILRFRNLFSTSIISTDIDIETQTDQTEPKIKYITKYECSDDDNNILTYGSSFIHETCSTHSTTTKDAITFSTANLHLTPRYASFGVFKTHSETSSTDAIGSKVNINIERELKHQLTGDYKLQGKRRQRVKNAVTNTFAKLLNTKSKATETRDVSEKQNAALLALVERNAPGVPISVLVANVGRHKAVLGRKDGIEGTPSFVEPSFLNLSEPNGGNSVARAINSYNDFQRANGGQGLTRGGTRPGSMSYAYHNQCKSTTESTTTSRTSKSKTEIHFLRHKINAALDEFIIVACDNVWNVMSDQEVIEFVRDELRVANSKCIQLVNQQDQENQTNNLYIQEKEKKKILKECQKVHSNTVSQYGQPIGQYLEFPDLHEPVKGYLMKTETDSYNRGKLYIHSNPPEKWKFGLMNVKTTVSKKSSFFLFFEFKYLTVLTYYFFFS